MNDFIASLTENIKYNKIWLTKDKYIFRISLGDHWYLKKFVVLYKYFLVDRNKITRNTLLEIANLFQKFVDSISNQSVRKDAENFFFQPTDFRKPETIIDFEKFNDLPKYDDTARKYFITYLMKIGMQSGIKKAIGELLYSDKSITISKIREAIPKIKQKEISKKETEGKVPRSVNDSIDTIFSDFHAEIRNYRQLLSYRGILPPEEDGYELNEIGKLICQADSTFIMAIWEHQKIKMRYSNPYTRLTTTDNAPQKYKKVQDFIDFKVNPYLALIEVIYELYNLNKNEAYITFEDYKFFICRESPFDVKIIVSKILQYRKLPDSEKKKIINMFDQRPKSREFSMDRKKSSSEDFLKELSNFIYGIYEYDYTTGKEGYNNLLKYQNKKLIINNLELFEIFAVYITYINSYLQSTYSELYDQVANYNSLKLIDEISQIESNTSDYLNTLKVIRKYYLERYGDDLNDFYENTLNMWRDYISYIDYKLLIFSYASVLCLNNYNLMKSDKNIIKKQLNDLSAEFVNVIGLDKEYLTKILEEIVIQIYNRKTFLNVLDENKTKASSEDKQLVENWLAQELKYNSYSVIKQKIQKEESDLIYSFSKGSRKRKRNLKMMLLVERERLENRIIMGKYRPNYPVDSCDICSRKFSTGEPECHHIIPFEIFGPDIDYNYVFLCNECHKIFTHKSLKYKRKEAIEKLKLKGLIKRSYFELMIKKGLLQKIHLAFLHKEGYIHIVDKMELTKMIDTAKFNFDNFDNFFKKTLPSAKRWNRAMKLVYFYRIKFSLIMEEIRLDYPKDRCDGCDTKFSVGEPECHHIISKKVFGSESPFNYTYLCINCHKQFTYNLSRKKEIISKLKQKNIVSINIIKQMLLNNEINKGHLKYLLQDEYITKKEYDQLNNLLIIYETYIKEAHNQ